MCVCKGVSLNIHTAGIYELYIFPQIMWIRLSGLTSAQMQENLKRSPGVLWWTQHSITSKKRMSSRGRTSFLVSISKLRVSLETTGCRKCTREPDILCLEEWMAQFRIIRLKEHFCHRLWLILELRKCWSVQFTKDMPTLFMGWLRLEETSSSSHFNQLLS